MCVVCVCGLLQEQQQLCAALQETKALLEEQLADTRARCSSLRELERDNLLLRQRIIDVEAVGTVRCYVPVNGFICVHKHAGVLDVRGNAE